MGCIYERKRFAGTDCVGCTYDRKRFHLYNCIFSSTVRITVFDRPLVAHDLILLSVCARRAYPRRFLGRVGRTFLSPTLTWRRFQMPSRKGVKTVCLAPHCTSVPLHLPSGLVLDLHNCYLVPVLSMNIISGSCLVRDGYSFKSENNDCYIYMRNIFYGHAPLKSGLFLLNLDCGEHIFTILMPKDAKLIMIVQCTCGTLV